MEAKALVEKWFSKWENGDFLDLPITNDFSHTSPYGTIKGKEEYIGLVEANKDKFLGHRFEIHDEIYYKNKACIRYTAFKKDFTLEVSEWHYTSEGLIKKIIAYYNIKGEISDDRKLKNIKKFG